MFHLYIFAIVAFFCVENAHAMESPAFNKKFMQQVRNQFLDVLKKQVLTKDKAKLNEEEIRCLDQSFVVVYSPKQHDQQQMFKNQDDQDGEFSDNE